MNCDGEEDINLIYCYNCSSNHPYEESTTFIPFSMECVKLCGKCTKYHNYRDYKWCNLCRNCYDRRLPHCEKCGRHHCRAPLDAPSSGGYPKELGEPNTVRYFIKSERNELNENQCHRCKKVSNKLYPVCLYVFCKECKNDFVKITL